MCHCFINDDFFIRAYDFILNQLVDLHKWTSVVLDTDCQPKSIIFFLVYFCLLWFSNLFLCEIQGNFIDETSKKSKSEIESETYA